MSEVEPVPHGRSCALQNRTLLAPFASADSDKDIAVLAICCSPHFFAIDWNSGAESDVDDEVLAVGYPKGSGGRVTATTGTAQDDWLGNTLGLVSHNAPLNPGNSGGPLFAMDGKVLGVNVGSSNFTEGLFYAVQYTDIQADVIAWKARLVVLPTPTPVVLEEADMWVTLGQRQDFSRYLSVQVDLAFDVDEGYLSVFVKGGEKLGQWGGVTVYHLPDD